MAFFNTHGLFLARFFWQKKRIRHLYMCSINLMVCDRGDICCHREGRQFG
jgi:hypothetical protein